MGVITSGLQRFVGRKQWAHAQEFQDRVTISRKAGMPLPILGQTIEPPEDIGLLVEGGIQSNLFERGDYLLGTFHLFKSSERSTSLDVNDSSVTTTFEALDLTALVGTDVSAVYMRFGMGTASSGDSSILVVREGGDTMASNDERALMFRIASEQGASELWLGVPVIVPARGTTPGKFEYAEYTTGHPVDLVQGVCWGRIRP
jgi:hypothetical protein